MYKNIICFFSFPFITENLRTSKRKRESETAEIYTHWGDATVHLWNRFLFYSFCSLFDTTEVSGKSMTGKMQACLVSLNGSIVLRLDDCWNFSCTLPPKYIYIYIYIEREREREIRNLRYFIGLIEHQNLTSFKGRSILATPANLG